MITKIGNFKVGIYFQLAENKRKLVKKMAEEVCLATQFLSLSCDEIHSRSKQELCNDMVKGENTYS